MLVVYICFLSLGATLFVFLERNYEEQRQNSALSSSKLVKSMVEALREENFHDDDIIRTFNYKHALWKYETEHVPVSWNLVYGEKVLFSMILITTIGYGNVAPDTDLGKYLCMLYIFLGIPLNVTLMRLLGLLFRSCLRSVLGLSRTILEGNWIPIVLGGVLYFTFFDVILVFGPAAAIDAVEDWTYLQSVYYCFVSLSTIGLGDYVAGLAARRFGSEFYNFYVCLLFLWLVFGLAFVAMCLNLVSYGIGTLLLDKLDCRCYMRAAAKKKMAAVYQCLAELNFQMAKGKPQAFNKMNVFEDFMTRCVENPENITEECLIHVFKVAEELRLAIFDEWKIDDELTLEEKIQHFEKSEPSGEDPDSEPPAADSKPLSGSSSSSEATAEEKESSINKVRRKIKSYNSESSSEDSNSKSDATQFSGISPHSEATAGTEGSTVSVVEETVRSSLNRDDGVGTHSSDSVNGVASIADGEYYSADDNKDENQEQESIEDDSMQRTLSRDNHSGEESDTSSDNSSFRRKNKAIEKSSDMNTEESFQKETGEDLGPEAEATDREPAEEPSVGIVHKKNSENRTE